MRLITTLLFASAALPAAFAVVRPSVALQRTAPPTADGEQHVAKGAFVQVTTRWRSERGLDRHANELLGIADAVAARVFGETPAADGAGEAAGSTGAAGTERALLQLTVFPSPAAFRTALENPDSKGADSKKKGGAGKRKRKAAAEAAKDAGALKGPVPISRRGLPDGGGTWLATAPKINDRVMFGTGVQPVARWAVAIEAAHAALAARKAPTVEVSDAESEEGRVRSLWTEDTLRAARAGEALSAAFRGMADAGFAKPDMRLDPYTSHGLAALRASVSPSGSDVDAIVRAAAEPVLDYMTYDVSGAFGASEADMARVLLYASDVAGMDTTSDAGTRERSAAALAYLRETSMAWSIEAGSVSRHPFGWQVVAPRRGDALVLSAEPMGIRPFTLRTKFAMYSNDLGKAAQADLVFGDVEGDRYLLVCNTGQGVYLFHRAGPDAPYETVTEFKEVPLPVAQPVAVVVRWNGSEFAINVAGADLPKQTLPVDTFQGHWGFGAHAGVSVLFSELVLDQ